MTANLCQREEAILSYIKHCIKTRGYPPSVREIGQAVGLKSSSTVHNYLRKLEEKEYIKRDPTKPRALEVLDNHENDNEYFKEILMIPLLGRVAAGSPLLASENREDVFPLPSDFTGRGDFFMLRVKGDSMIEAGILEGDMVLVRKQPQVENGDIAVVMINDEATIKRFYKENEHIRLQPENYRLSPIIVKDAYILGKVVGLLRKM